MEAAACPPRIILNPGDFYFGAAPARLITLLGSCVTVTLWHPCLRLGGMCHILLPDRPKDPNHPDRPCDGRYADEAFQLFDAAALRHAIPLRDCQARLFGGGNMFPAMKSLTPLGQQNVHAARSLILERNIPLLSEHAGGYGHRKLSFDLDTGLVELEFTDLAKILPLHAAKPPAPNR